MNIDNIAKEYETFGEEDSVRACANVIQNKPLWEKKDEKRMEAIMQNGNSGEHYGE